MSRLNVVRKIKDSKKDPIKIQDTFETKREKGWNERFIYNKLEDNNQEKRPIPKKAKNDYSSNINYLRAQFNGENFKKSNKKRGKSGYKFHHQNKLNINSNNKNKINIDSNNIFKFKNVNNTGENEVEDASVAEEKKIRYTKNNYKIINKNNNSADYNNNINNISNNQSISLYNLGLNELEVYLGLLWNKLGVKDSFQKTFNKLKEDMESEDAKKEFTIMEIQNLENLEKFLKKLCLEIENREKAVLLLKKLIEVIEKQFIELNIDIRENFLKDLYQTIIGYRINTIKVVESLATYNQLFSHPINKGKYYEEYIQRKYKFFDNDKNNNNGNYLLKIKNDLNFLGKSKINGYKNLNLFFSSNSDPFLLNVSEQVPIDIEYYLRIKQCQYNIMQEVIFDSINPESGLNNSNISDIKENKKKKLEPINKSNSKILNNNNSTNNISVNNPRIIKKENIDCLDKKENTKNNNDKQIKEYNENKNKKKMIGMQLIDRNDYEKFFGNKNINDDLSEEQTLEELKKEFNNIKNLKNNNKETNKIQIENKVRNENNNEKNIKIINKDNKQGVNLHKENKTTNNIEITNNIKEEIIIKENYENKENNVEEKIKNTNKEEINNEKIQEEIKKNNNIIEDIKKEIVNNDETNNKKNSINKILEDKDNNEDLVNIEENININEEKMKNLNINKDNNIDNNVDNNKIKNKDNNKEENILESSLVINNNLKSPKQKSRSTTPKSIKGSKIISIQETPQNKDNNNLNNKDEINIHQIKDNDYIAFYCGKISNFISIYKTYYNTIPEEQKLIFNLKSDPLEYLYNNFYPKIIIYSDKKSKNIKGLCIISHIFTNEAKNNGLYIEHISSYNEESKEIIFEKLLCFIKENSYTIFGFENNKKDKDIYIDLHYKSEDGKFTINTEIRDFFRNQLKFKWVKLENLSKFVRFQKMRHQFMINNGNNNIDLLNNEYDDNNILNQSILGRKEFGNEENNNESDKEEESEEDEINIDISTIFDADNKINDLNKNTINKDINETHFNKTINLLNNFSIKNKTILKFNTKVYTKKSNLTTFIKYSNPFNFIYLLSKINEDKNISFNEISSKINNYFNKKDSSIINQLLSNSLTNNKAIIIENNYYYSNIQELIKKNKNKFKINANLNLFPIFDKCISFNYKNYYYNRIQQKKIQTFKDRETNQIFFMINKTDNHIILISSSLNDNFKQKYINEQNKDNLSINFIEIYNNLIDLDNMDDNILYIPAFEIKSKLVNNCFTNTNQDYKSNLYCFEDYYNIKHFSEEIMTIKNNKNIKKNKNYNGNICMSFDYDLIKEEDINKENFIKDSFLIIVLNINLIESLRALPLLTLFVSKDNFISK